MSRHRLILENGHYLAASVLAFLSGCGSASETGPDEPRTEPVTRVSTSERAEFIQRTQAQADLEYAVHEERGRLIARNAAQRLAARFDPDHLVIASETDSASAAGVGLELAFAGMGRGGARVAARLDGMSRTANRVEYARQGLTEWYVNGPLGLEQGFSIPTRPQGQGTVEIAMNVGEGTVATLAEDGASVELLAADGSQFRMTDLSVVDASGRVLASQFAVHDGEVAVGFDDAGAVYPVEVDPLVFQFGIVAFDRSTAARFGNAIAVSGDSLIIGAYNVGASSATALDGSGKVYPLKRQGSSWGFLAPLLPQTPAKARFGGSVAISPDAQIVAVGATGEAGGGRVHIYVPFNGNWSQQASISGANSGDEVGCSVALASNTLVYGSCGVSSGKGRFAITERSGTSWTTTKTVNGSAASGLLGTWSVISGTTLAVSAPGETVSSAAGAGRVYVYVKSGSSWTLQGSLNSPNPTASGDFGRRVALSGNTLVVGEPGSDLKGKDSGAVHVFTRSGSTWSHVAQLAPSTAAAGTFYSAVALSANGLLIASRAKSPTAAALFTGSGGSWTQQSLITAPSGSTQFSTPAMSDKYAFIGDPVFSESSRPNEGAVNWYKSPQSNGSACTSAGDCASGFCTDGVCCNSACGSSAADCQACSTAAGGTTNGTCTPLNSTKAPVTVCRAAVPGGCDVPETCTSSSTTCPTDIVQPFFTTCRDSLNPFCVGLCDGATNVCPAAPDGC